MFKIAIVLYNTSLYIPHPITTCITNCQPPPLAEHCIICGWPLGGTVWYCDHILRQIDIRHKSLCTYACRDCCQVVRCRWQTAVAVTVHPQVPSTTCRALRSETSRTAWWCRPTKRATTRWSRLRVLTRASLPSRRRNRARNEASDSSDNCLCQATMLSCHVIACQPLTVQTYDPYPILYVSVFKLPAERIHQGLKNKIIVK